MSIYREEALYPTIADYLHGKGYNVRVRYRLKDLTDNEIDVLAYNSEKKILIAVEAKIRNAKKGFYQANQRLFFSDFVYLAFPEKYAYFVKKKYMNELKKWGFGLLAVNGYVKEIVKPKNSTFLMPNFKKIILNSLRKEGDI